MTGSISSSGRRGPVRNDRREGHKFPPGAHVICKIGVLSEKAPSEILRQLPDGGAGLQYRIRGDRDGVERVVTESSIVGA